MKIFFIPVAIVISISCLNAQSINEKFPHTLPFENITINGELKTRALANFDRLERDKYLPGNLFITEAQSGGWPGDTEGRTILGLTLLAEATHRPPKYLSKIMQILPSKLNSQGFFGTNHRDTVSEQQLSSHGWVLRALSEYYLWKKDANTLNIIDKMIQNLALPSTGQHKLYQINPTERKHSGSYSGTSSSTIGKWIVSTDIGCDYIFLDGLTQVYQIKPSEPLKELIEEMINRFLEVDLVAIKAQTHASLTALRSLLRYYEITGNEKYLKEVQKRFDIYLHEGMTENYENYNWFGRPEWTESCAVIDSYIVAFALWRFTGNAEYLEYAHRIYYNGICFEQRFDGSFGSQNCTGSKNPFLTVEITDVNWCCTMRGGEGLARTIENIAYIQDQSITIPFFASAEVKIPFGLKHIIIKEETKFPYNPSIKFIVKESTLNFNPEFRLYIPPYSKNITITLNGKPIKYNKVNGFAIVKEKLVKSDVIIYSFDSDVYSRQFLNNNSIKGYIAFQYGSLLLGIKDTADIKFSKCDEFTRIDSVSFKSQNSGIIFHPITHLLDSSVTKEANYKRRVLFRYD
jgi:hypothetical protein